MATEKMVDLNGEIAVITGGNGGIGRRIPGSAEVSRVRVYGSVCDLTGASEWRGRSDISPPYGASAVYAGQRLQMG